MECKGLSIGPIYLSRENKYKCVNVKIAGVKDYGTDENGRARDRMCVVLGQKLSDTVEVGEYLNGKCVIVLTVNADGEERWKIGRPEEVLVSAEDLAV